MSGIAGVFRRDGASVDPAQLRSMADRLSHRGPDGSGVWHVGPVGLCQQRSSNDLESGVEKLPLIDRAGDLVLVADARIDNREELFTNLQLGGNSLAETGDGALILGAYRRYGERLPEKLVGDFALAIWDAQQRVLFCARDAMGVKPFYYYESERLFAFGTEIKALLGLDSVPRRLNELEIAKQLERRFDDVTATHYCDIVRLAPAHALGVTPDRTSRRRYWDLDPSYELRLGSDAEYVEAFREAFSEAVRCRLRSRFPVGTTLSGGLDSSSIACKARDLLAGGTPLHSFSAIFPSLAESDLRRIDERPFMEAVTEGGGIVPHWIRADQVSPLIDMDKVLWHQDQPILAANLYMHWAMYGEARRHGIRVFLDGLDGDTTVSHGLGRLEDLTRRLRWRSLWTEAAALSERVPRSLTPWQIVKEYGLKPALPPSTLRLWRALRGRSETEPAPGIPLNPDLNRRVGLDPTEAGSNGRESRPRTPRDGHWLGLMDPLMTRTLEIADHAAAAFGLEPRYPFFDRRLIELCLALPLDLKLRNGWTRFVLRQAMQGCLPEPVCWRIDKGDLGPNLRSGLLERESLAEQVVSRANSIPLLGDYLNLEELPVWLRRIRGKPTPAAAFDLYQVVNFALWIERESGVR
jgi:asparagine synthase (glutamine-hydrolysing)